MNHKGGSAVGAGILVFIVILAFVIFGVMSIIGQSAISISQNDLNQPKLSGISTNIDVLLKIATFQVYTDYLVLSYVFWMLSVLVILAVGLTVRG